jgi:hypothetical protein
MVIVYPFKFDSSDEYDTSSSSNISSSGGDDTNKEVSIPRAALLLVYVQERALRSGWLATCDPQPPFNVNLDKIDNIDNIGGEKGGDMTRSFARIEKLFGKTFRNASVGTSFAYCFTSRRRL